MKNSKSTKKSSSKRTIKKPLTLKEYRKLSPTAKKALRKSLRKRK